MERISFRGKPGRISEWPGGLLGGLALLHLINRIVRDVRDELEIGIAASVSHKLIVGQADM